MVKQDDNLDLKIKSTKPLPSTAARMIGWRSTDPNLKLEKFGSQARKKCDILKVMKWPKEAI